MLDAAGRETSCQRAFEVADSGEGFSFLLSFLCVFDVRSSRRAFILCSHPFYSLPQIRSTFSSLFLHFPAFIANALTITPLFVFIPLSYSCLLHPRFTPSCLVLSHISLNYKLTSFCTVDTLESLHPRELPAPAYAALRGQRPLWLGGRKEMNLNFLAVGKSSSRHLSFPFAVPSPFYLLRWRGFTKVEPPESVHVNR